MNDMGRGSGLGLLVILLVALIVALLMASQMKSLGMGGTSSGGMTSRQQDAVEQAQGAVDAINSRMKSNVDVEGLG
jgi:preprotein translocase subunit SecG